MRISVPEAAHPLVKRTYQIAASEGHALIDVSRRSGVSDAGIRNWRTRYQPTIDSLEAVLNVMGYELAIQKKHAPKLARIIDVVGEECGVSRNAIVGQSGYRNVVAARKLVCFLARELTTQSSVQIGRAINRDHSTVLTHIKAVSDQLPSNQKLSTRVDLITARLGAGDAVSFEGVQ